jgi:hypothetical protein
MLPLVEVMVIILTNRDWPKGVSVDVTVRASPTCPVPQAAGPQPDHPDRLARAVIAYHRDLEPDRPDGRMTSGITLPAAEGEQTIAV